MVLSCPLFQCHPEMNSRHTRGRPDCESVTSRLYPIEDLDKWSKTDTTNRSLLQIRKESLQNISKSSLSLDEAAMKKKVPSSSDSEEFILGQIQDDPEGQTSRRWYAIISIVVYGMIFNGSVFGYTSPALLTLQDQSEDIAANQNGSAFRGWLSEVRDDLEYHLEKNVNQYSCTSFYILVAYLNLAWTNFCLE